MRVPERVSVAVDVCSIVGESLLVLVALRESDVVDVIDAVSVPLIDPEPVNVPLVLLRVSVLSREAVADPDMLPVSETVLESVPVRLPVSSLVADLVRLAVSSLVKDVVDDRVVDRVAVELLVAVRETLPLLVIVPITLVEAVTDVDRVAVKDSDCERVTDIVHDDDLSFVAELVLDIVPILEVRLVVLVAERDKVREPVRLKVRVVVDDKVADKVITGDIVTLPLDLVELSVKVELADIVPLYVPVPENERELLTLEVAVLDGVRVPVAMRVKVALLDKIDFVIVPLSVRVGVAVAVPLAPLRVLSIVNDDV